MTKTATATLALLALASPVFGGPTEAGSDPLTTRTRTEVTVSAPAVPVETAATPVQKQLRRGGVRGGVARTLRGFGHFTGWIMNVDDDIQPSRSRRAVDASAVDAPAVSDGKAGR